MTDETVKIQWADGNGNMQLAAGPDGVEYDTWLVSLGFNPELTIGDDPAQSYCTIQLWVRHSTGECIVDVGHVNGWVSVAARTIAEGLDLCARWAPMVSASALARWPGSQAAD